MAQQRLQTGVYSSDVGDIVERVDRPVPKKMQSKGYRAGAKRRKKARVTPKGAIGAVRERYRRAMEM